VVLAGGGEHDDGDLGVAEHGELARLLHDPGAALGVGDLAVGGVLDPLDLDLAAPHLGILLGQRVAALRLHGLELLASWAKPEQILEAAGERGARGSETGKEKKGKRGTEKAEAALLVIRRRRRW